MVVQILFEHAPVAALHDVEAEAAQLIEYEQAGIFIIVGDPDGLGSKICRPSFADDACTQIGAVIGIILGLVKLVTADGSTMYQMCNLSSLSAEAGLFFYSVVIEDIVWMKSLLRCLLCDPVMACFT